MCCGARDLDQKENDEVGIMVVAVLCTARRRVSVFIINE